VNVPVVDVMLPNESYVKLSLTVPAVVLSDVMEPKPSAW